MIFKKIAYFLLLSIVLTGCASAPRNYVPEMKERNYPSIGEVVIAEIGEEMLVQGFTVKTKALNLLQEGKIWAYTITPGFFKKVGEDSRHEYFSPKIETGSGTIRPISGQPDFSASIKLNKQTNETCIIRPTDATVCGKLVFDFVDLSVSHPKNFQQTLIYSGKKGEIMTLSYREFINDTARPAFYNDVDYDLSESSTIGYKGARIDVIEANNTQIKYKVEKGFK